jgi:hypothetical protein
MYRITSSAITDAGMTVLLLVAFLLVGIPVYRQAQANPTDPNRPTQAQPMVVQPSPVRAPGSIPVDNR